MNPRNALRELLGILEMSHANDADRTMVADETICVLANDAVLKTEPFNESKNALLSLLQKSKGKPNCETLIPHLTRELLDKIDGTYIGVAFELLNAALVQSLPAQQETRRELIEQVVGSLLSTLADGGASLETLFQLYRQILVPVRQSPAKYEFRRRFGLLGRIVQQPPKTYAVLFAIDNVKNENDFPAEMGSISFSSKAEGWSATVEQVATYIAPRARRIFAELTVEARDIRAAGTQAYTRIGNVLDLTRFEYERERVQLSEEFLIRDTEPPNRAARYSIPKVVPNPVTTIRTPELATFVTSVNELLSSRNFSTEGRDRVLSAFRLYRQGADTNSFENKLTSWWTAIEYLIRGKGGKQIGTTVEQGLAPVLCLVYPEKLLLDARQTLVKANSALVDPVSHVALPLKDMNILELCKTLCRSDITPLVNAALDGDPYVQKRIGAILKTLGDAKLYSEMLKQHEQRVRWHIQRLWRARCDILHSATLRLSGVLLCANLEFYLKTALMALLAELRRIKTLSSPEEFFDRQQFAYTRIADDLGNNSLAMLHSFLGNNAT
jgi:hypothetical protein